MIYRLRRKFIVVCFISFCAALLLILGLSLLLSHIQTTGSLDSLTDMIAENDGHFPEFGPERFRTDQSRRNFIDRETPFTTRYFIVKYNDQRNVVFINIDAISRINSREAQQYALQAIAKGKERGYLADYRYKIATTEEGLIAVFVDAGLVRSLTRAVIIVIAVTFTISSIIVLLFIMVISKYAIKPLAESYDKQKQFVSDANHELKTPLTLILTNADIMENEIGKNEWLDDIKMEGQRMGNLINQLGLLAKMDEEEAKTEIRSFDLSEACIETFATFGTLAKQNDLSMESRITSNITYEGDEVAIRRLISILLDNAIKHGDKGGKIQMILEKKKHVLLIVENTCKDIKNIKLDFLFDRFYRSEEARTAGDSFGIGLAIAKSIVEKHHGKIVVQNIKDEIIRFEASL